MIIPCICNITSNKCCFYSSVFIWIIWAPSSEFVSSSIPSWQILTAHALPFRGAKDLAFCLKVPLDWLLALASSGGSGETARMRRLAWTFAARIGDKYQIRLTRSIWKITGTSVQYMSRLMTKPSNWYVRPPKTQISLGIRPVWSQFSLCAWWVAKDPSFLHADSDDSDQTGWMPRLIWVFPGCTRHFVGFIMRCLIFKIHFITTTTMHVI